ncbi:Nudix family hydrolase [Parapusillimonas granuli]|uniref:8-oxo-dGTP diphosphatase n=1 Tax=Parapusillimonas granuli TaxID=380911 RepID=A0A853G2B9_9BURK|nr:Nudix family hydrolase [Parapusillimonas granuli]MBB5214671.1 8-oxo-dGTP diphosphatase [Parapusillimonas granuli]NYT48921.1 Nudix family hydrolase [Parapusillimonas granuli]
MSDPTHAPAPGDAAGKPFIRVAAGVILKPDGSVLLGRRPADKPWPGWWELPGGKLEPGETVLEALARELKEELDIEVTDASPWVTYTHEYPKNIVQLAFCQVRGWVGEPRCMEDQQLAWVDPSRTPLPVGPLLPATEPPLRWLRLPDRYLITAIGGADGLAAYLARLEKALSAGVRLVQFREPAWAGNGAEDAHAAFRRVLRQCRRHGARCLVNSCHPESWWAEADGVHLRAADARLRAAGVPASGADATRPLQSVAPGLLGVSAHTAADLDAARALGADFAVLGHVLDTPSHPGQAGMGWARFAELARDAGLPVFAIGGQSEATLADARRHGAHGIAGIRRI